MFDFQKMPLTIVRCFDTQEQPIVKKTGEHDCVTLLKNTM